MPYETLLEWLDDNSHRKFPLDDSATGIDVTGAQTLPTSLIVDLFLCVPVTADITKFYLKSVLIARYFINVEIGYVKADTTEIIIGRFTEIPTDQANNSTYYLEPAEQPLVSDLPFTKSTGALVIGRCTEALQVPGYYEFSASSGKLLSTRISQGLAAVQQITVGSSILTGNIAFKEGDNVKFTSRYDIPSDTTIVTISANISSLQDLGIPLVSDAAVMASLTKMYGIPIATINGIQPNASTYNFEIEGVDCTSVEPVAAGISITNKSCQPCCDKTMLDAAYAAISELNKRYAQMESYYDTIGRNVNEIQARMVALEIP